MNYCETLNYIHSLGNFSLPAGLERIRNTLGILGNPQNSLRSIHIAGTNGKGSVSAMLSSVFKTAGYKTGLFVSPYIIDFTERIQINGEFISEEDLCFYAKKVKDTGAILSEFEFITALAFLYFKEKNIDVLICETGLGGRFDATNTLDNLLVAVITKIGLDHTAILGDSVEKIAFEKCGILRDCPAVSSPFQAKEALDVIKSSAKELYIPQTDSLKVIYKNIHGSKFLYRKKEYEISLCGDYQIENAMTAIEALSVCGCNIPYDTVYKGLKEAYLPARMEIISNNPIVILDGAHNPDGAKVLAKELKKYSGSITAVIGMMKDKDYKTVLQKTLCHCKNVVAVRVPDLPRSLEAKEILKLSENYCKSFAAKNLSDAVEQAVNISNGEPLFIFGSLYLASAIRPILKEKFKK